MCRTGSFDDSPRSASEDVARLRLRLRHLSLSELAATEVVDWDEEAHVVTKGPHFDSMWDKIG